MTPTASRPTNVNERLAVLALMLALVLGFGKAPAVLGLNEAQSQLWFMVGWVAVSLVTGLACWRAAAKSGGSDRKAWRSFAIGCLMWMGGTVTWVSYGWFGAALTFPGLADIFFSLTSVAFMFGIFHYSLPGSGGTRIQMTNFALALAAVFAVASVLYFPVLMNSKVSALGAVVALSYPIAWLATFVFCLICYSLYVDKHRAFPFLLILGGVGSAAVADLFFGFDLFAQAYSIARFYNMLWLASFALLGWAALEYVRSSEIANQPAHRRESRVQPGEAFIPALSVAAVLSAGVAAESHHQGASVLIVLPVVIGFAALLGIREYSLFTTERNLRAQAEDTSRRLAESEAQLSAILENTTDGVVVLDRDWRVVFANGAAAGTAEGRPYLGVSLWELFPEFVDSELHSNYHKAMEEQSPIDCEVYLPTFAIWLEVQALPTPETLTIFFRDVTERRQLRDELVRLSRHDPLTGLANRAVFGERLALGLESGRRHTDLVLVLIDLDGFKAVNDTMGHLAGDELLQQFARRLTGLVRQGDTVARFGGDEFAIIQPGPVEPDGGAEVARRIFEALDTPFEVQGSEVTLAASIGIAVAPSHGTRPDELVLNADLALYRAKASKASRLNYCIFEPAVDGLAHSPRPLRHDRPRTAARA